LGDAEIRQSPGRAISGGKFSDGERARLDISAVFMDTQGV
jgi:hypothetical protein